MPPSFTPCAAPLGNSVKQCERCKSHYCRGRRSGQRTPEISYVQAAHVWPAAPMEESSSDDDDEQMAPAPAPAPPRAPRKRARAGSRPPARAAVPKMSPKKRAMKKKQAQRRSRGGGG